LSAALPTLSLISIRDLVRCAAMRKSALAFVCAAALGACAWGEGGGSDDDGPTPDASSGLIICGDGTCAPSEVGSCTQDCGANNPVCGNGSCQGPSETNASCPADCPPAGPICGDAVCDMAGGENSTNCPGDCMGGGGGNIDCNDDAIVFACGACLFEPGACSVFGVTEADCLSCVGLLIDRSGSAGPRSNAKRLRSVDR
jgi:hypothetical protein